MRRWFATISAVSTELQHQARRVRQQIQEAKDLLAGLYDERARLIKLLEHDLTNREIADLFGIKQPLVSRTLNDRFGRRVED